MVLSGRRGAEGRGWCVHLWQDRLGWGRAQGRLGKRPLTMCPASVCPLTLPRLPQEAGRPLPVLESVAPMFRPSSPRGASAPSHVDGSSGEPLRATLTDTLRLQTREEAVVPLGRALCSQAQPKHSSFESREVGDQEGRDASASRARAQGTSAAHGACAILFCARYVKSTTVSDSRECVVFSAQTHPQTLPFLGLIDTHWYQNFLGLAL